MQSQRSRRQVFSLFMVFLMVLAGATSVLAAPSNRHWTVTPLTSASNTRLSVGKNNAALPQNALGANSASRMISVIVKLDVDGLATYRGGIAGLSATSPSVTGAAKLNVHSLASISYLNYIDQKQRTFEAAAQAALPQARITTRYRNVFGGVAMVVPRDQLAQIAKIPGVRSVYLDRMQQLDTDRTPQFLGATKIWNQLGGQAHAGEGVVVGVLDTGIWPEHPSFADPDPLGNAFPAPPATAAALPCDFGSAVPGDVPFTCNNKLIGAYRFMTTYDTFGPPLLPGEFTSARDSDGHGTHTTSTAAGNAGVKAEVLGVARGTISGIAPRAHVIAYKVCGADGCFTSDSMAATDQAITDGVDAINFSIGGGSDPYGDGSELAFLDAYAAGVFVAASAGNSGPDPDTTDHFGPWVTTVAASTSDRSFVSTLTVQSGSTTLTLDGASLTAGVPNFTPVITVSDALCTTPLEPGTANGKIVACQRGSNARVEKGYNVLQGGAVGMILYNASLADVETDNHWLPTVHLADGTSFVDFLQNHTNVVAKFTAGKAKRGQGDVMAAFSSRGGPGQSLGVSKPDVTAPGVQILAGHTPAPDTILGGPSGELFQAIAGTSMSSPHVAGAGALLKALHPSWTPGQIKSALMTTAKTAGVLKEDEETPADAFDYGSGRIDLRKAGDPGLTFDATAADYLLYKDRLWQANYPSLYVPTMPGRVTVQRTVHNVQNHNAQWHLEVQAPADVTISVPPKIFVPAGGDASFAITVDARNVPIDEVRFATLLLKSGGRQLHFPITFVRSQATIGLEKSCDPATIGIGDTTTCTISATNSAIEDATVFLSDALPEQLALSASSVVSATARGNNVFFSGSLRGAEPPDVNVADGAGTSPAGYLPLSTFGVDPFTDAGDETLFNLDVPAFTYAGETYTSIGMVSNGYAVVGGGTTEDIQFVNQVLPDPSPPNNVLAPFWTDLNPESGGELRAVLLTDDVSGDSWLVLEWEEVANFGDRAPNSFQIWIGLNDQEDISFTYGAVSSGDGGFLTVGAENKFGNRGANFYVDGTGTAPSAGTEVRVTSTPGAPGETRTITFEATGVQTGEWTNCAEMTSPSFFGTSIACFSGEVEP